MIDPGPANDGAGDAKGSRSATDVVIFSCQKASIKPMQAFKQVAFHCHAQAGQSWNMVNGSH